ncbi:serine/arginine repetitive matrix protein 1-like [Apus apus]|uniref:serine/arginine repetitive matrix protein 1-like n=1 Tax=Apus apus TaxID=8895 RepID=UPI0021F84009|nr:serine/arginine repetitive matrix protein 1-like [Apus apus]
MTLQIQTPPATGTSASPRPKRARYSVLHRYPHSICSLGHPPQEPRLRSNRSKPNKKSSPTAPPSSRRRTERPRCHATTRKPSPAGHTGPRCRQRRRHRPARRGSAGRARRPLQAGGGSGKASRNCQSLPRPPPRPAHPPPSSPAPFPEHSPRCLAAPSLARLGRAPRRHRPPAPPSCARGRAPIH